LAQSFNKQYSIAATCGHCGSNIYRNIAKQAPGGYTLTTAAFDYQDTTRLFIETQIGQDGLQISQDTLAAFHQFDPKILSLPDGSFAFYETTPDGRPKLTKKTADGTVIWSQEYDNQGFILDAGKITVQVNDLNELFLAAVQSTQSIADTAHILVKKLGADGTVVWETTQPFYWHLPKEMNLIPGDVADDGGVILTYTVKAGSFDYIWNVLRLDGMGTVVLNQNYSYYPGWGYNPYVRNLDAGQGRTLTTSTTVGPDGYPNEAYVKLFGTAGNLLWFTKLEHPPASAGLPAKTFVDALAMANDGNFILAGHSEDAYPDQFFIAKLDSDGNTLWRKDNYGFLGFAQLIEELPGGGMLVSGKRGYNQAWVMVTDSLGNVPCPILTEITAHLCYPPQGYFFGGQYLNNPGRYYKQYASPDGCDSMVILQLTYPIAGVTDTAQICEGGSFMWRDSSYTQPGLHFFDASMTAHGCDTMHRLFLVVSPHDSMEVDIHLCVGAASPFTGTIYQTEGEFSEQLDLQGLDGCDSLVDATVFVHPNEFLTLENSVPYGTLYQGIVLTQDTQFVLYDTTAVGCLLTITENVTVGPSAVGEPMGALGLRLFPNPFSNDLHLDFYLPKPMPFTASLLDPLGRQVAVMLDNKGFEAGEHHLTLSGKNLSPGLYQLRVQAGEAILFQKLLKI
ncbi:MAG: T9SS type A sorting domain-containing protein, partial [Saprospiraceae bacterium]|nr:T9SS type A sorting domain-containing protein [Saprospiraceae bacterium]